MGVLTPDQTKKEALPDEDELLLAAEEEREEDKDEDESDEDGKGDTTALALDVPEPAQAMAADAGLGKDGLKQKGIKGKGGKAKAGDKEALAVALDDDLLGLDEAEEEEPESKEEIRQEASAYDSDEITDPDAEDIDPLMMVLGGQEKPWENEKLSVVERMMLKPGYERDTDALKQDQDSDAPKAKEKSRIVKGAAIAAGVVALAAGAAHAARTEGGGPGIAGISKGPQRAAEQEQPQVKVEVRKQNIQQTVKSEPITIQARQNAEEVTLRRIGTGLAATVGLNNSASDFDKSKAAVQRSEGMDLQDMLEIQRANDGPDIEMAWTPNAPGQSGFTQTMDMIYAGIGAQTLMNVSPYRQAGWDEKRLEQKENSQDVTIAPQGPEPKTPAPDLNYHRNFQINLGPGGM